MRRKDFVRPLRATDYSREWQEMVRNVCMDIDHGSLEKSEAKWALSVEEMGTCDCILTLAVTLGANQFPRWLRSLRVCWPSPCVSVNGADTLGSHWRVACHNYLPIKPPWQQPKADNFGFHQTKLLVLDRPIPVLTARSTEETRSYHGCIFGRHFSSSSSPS